MKIFIFSDMEGISGICGKSQVKYNEANYSEGRRYMTWDINACVQGCIDGGATEIVVRDGHGRGCNVIWEELNERAEYIIGAPGKNRFEGIDGFDGLILLGYHAMAGTFQGILEHTFSSTLWQNLWMNNRKVGEFSVDASIAGEHGVPVIMTSGDDKLCAEAESVIEGIVAVQVKQGLSTEGGKLLPMKTAHRKIREGAVAAVKNCRKVKPLKCASPVTMRLELVERGHLPSCKPYVKVIDGRTFEVTSDSVENAFHLLL